MPKIKIEDIPERKELDNNDLKWVTGGFGSDGGVADIYFKNPTMFYHPIKDIRLRNMQLPLRSRPRFC